MEFLNKLWYFSGTLMKIQRISRSQFDFTFQKLQLVLWLSWSMCQSCNKESLVRIPSENFFFLQIYNFWPLYCGTRTSFHFFSSRFEAGRRNMVEKGTDRYQAGIETRSTRLLHFGSDRRYSNRTGSLFFSQWSTEKWLIAQLPCGGGHLLEFVGSARQEADGYSARVTTAAPSPSSSAPRPALSIGDSFIFPNDFGKWKNSPGGLSRVGTAWLLSCVLLRLCWSGELKVLFEIDIMFRFGGLARLFCVARGITVAMAFLVWFNDYRNVSLAVAGEKSSTWQLDSDLYVCTFNEAFLPNPVEEITWFHQKANKKTKKTRKPEE